jgi:hypothetical protein
VLKITIQPEKRSTKLLLEGRLTGPWVKELNRCWDAAVTAPNGEVTVDLSGVTFIDAEGKALLTQMWQQGAKFQAAGCLTRSIVEEITQAHLLEPGSERA